MKPSAQPEQFQELRGHQYLNLTTFRKSGEPVRTPVWFAEGDGKLYLFTNGNTGKVKRIRATAQVRFGPADARGTPLGVEHTGEARILSGTDAQQADQALTHKYGLIKRIFSLVARIRRQQAIYIAVLPIVEAE